MNKNMAIYHYNKKSRHVKQVLRYQLVFQVAIGAIFVAIAVADMFTDQDARLWTEPIFNLFLIAFIATMGFFAWAFPNRKGNDCVCDRCDYPVGLESRSNVCTECGADLAQEGAIANGRRSLWLGRSIAVFVWILAMFLALWLLYY